MLVVFVLCAALAVIAALPELPIAKALRAWLIEEPSRLLEKVTLAKLLAVLVTIAVVLAVAAALSQVGLPPDIGFVLAGDITTYLDIIIAAALTAATVRISTLFEQTSRSLKRAALMARGLGSGLKQRRQAHRRVPSTPKRRTPRRDDKDAPAGLGLAFA